MGRRGSYAPWATRGRRDAVGHVRGPRWKSVLYRASRGTCLIRAQCFNLYTQLPEYSVETALQKNGASPPPHTNTKRKIQTNFLLLSGSSSFGVHGWGQGKGWVPLSVMVQVSKLTASACTGRCPVCDDVGVFRVYLHRTGISLAHCCFPHRASTQ